MNATQATVSSRSVRFSDGPRNYRAEAARRSRAWIGLTVAIVAGALMMAAAYMSASGLRNTAWEKQEAQTTQPVHAAPQGAATADTGAYVTASPATTQP